jgi:hypothetical protein
MKEQKHYVDSARTFEILNQDSGLLPKPRADWNTFVPKEGDLAYVDETDSEYIFNGSAWVEYTEEKSL